MFDPNPTADRPIRIGDWIFLRGEAAICRGDERRRLESRSADVLAMLAERRGEVVTPDDLIERIWGGRIISSNSIAVVIADLRKAFDDNARVPQFIETIPKRGYRLTANAPRAVIRAAEPATAGRTNFAAASVMLGILAVLIAIGFYSESGVSAVPLVVGSFTNRTGDERYAPLSVSVRELAITALGKAKGVRIENGTSAPQLRLTGRLIIWSGHPSTTMSVVDARTGTIVWTGMASGPEVNFPRQVPAQMADLAAQLTKSKRQ